METEREWKFDCASLTSSWYIQKSKLTFIADVPDFLNNNGVFSLIFSSKFIFVIPTIYFIFLFQKFMF